MKGRFKGTKGMILLGIMVLLVVGFYFYIANIASPKEGEVEKLTAVQEVLLRDLDRNYPPSPKEVIKYYGTITQCFYGEEYTEEELYDLAMKAQELYDAELVANKTEEQYMIDLKNDIKEFAANDWVVSSFTTSSSTDVEYFNQDNYEWARMYCIFSIRTGTAYQNVNYAFLLRKDENSHWKIYGWTEADNVIKDE
ncbi:MAG: hypothetical protein IJ485_00180 [Lachnospiraceae bacterium]|nr:hypothetical protein [Lachnospiraceae bacterium]